MRKLAAAVCLLGAMVLPAHAAEVAVLDWRAALMNTQSAQSSLSQLEGQIGNQQREAQSLGNELQQLQERLQREGDTMSQSQRDSLMAELQQKGSRFEQQFLESAESKLERAVEQVLERHNIDVLVEPQGVLHSSTDLPNVTNEVTQIFDSLN